MRVLDSRLLGDRYLQKLIQFSHSLPSVELYGQFLGDILHLGVVGIEGLFEDLAALLQEEYLAFEAIDAAAVPQEGLNQRDVP